MVPRETVNVVSRESQCADGKIETRGEKIDCFPRGQSVCDLLYSWEFIKPRCNAGRWSAFAGNSALLLSDVIDFARFPAQRFWRETASLLDIT